MSSGTKRVYATPFAVGLVDYLDVPLLVAEAVEYARESGAHVRTTLCISKTDSGPAEPHIGLDKVAESVESLLRAAGFQQIHSTHQWYWCVWGAD